MIHYFLIAYFSRVSGPFVFIDVVDQLGGGECDGWGRHVIFTFWLTYLGQTFFIATWLLRKLHLTHLFFPFGK